MGLGGTQLAQILTEVHWNEKFASWHRPPSDSEEDRIRRTARMIKDAIRADPQLAGLDIEVIPQGSYHSNTNVRLNSDMDLCVRYNGQCVYSIPPGVDATLAQMGVAQLLPTGTVEATARDLKRALHSILAGIGQVEWGNKALKVAAVEGSRVDADVVPAVGYTLARPAGLLGIPYPVKGAAIYTDEGRWIFNFPEQHHQRGKEKNDSTGRRYKRTVRILKHLKGELLTIGLPPSFLIESLAYNCPDELFAGDDWYQTVFRVLGRVRDQTGNPLAAAPLVEANCIKPLFASDQPWARADAHGFALSALARIAS